MADAARAAELVVAICTFRRREGLERTLSALARTQRPDVTVEVLVVDNDPDGSAAWLRDRTDLVPVPLRYAHEPRSGLTYARNRAIDEVRGATAIVFLDDDEAPSEAWLCAMWDAHLRYPGDVQIGPVISELSRPLPEWATETWPFSRPEHPDGTVLTSGGDGNALLPLAALNDPETRYDHRFARSGGQDEDLFRRLRRRGVQLRWAAGARVDEWIPPERMELGFTVERARWGGATVTYIACREGLGGWARRIGTLPRDAVRGPAEIAIGRLTRDPVKVAHGRWTFALARGTLLGLRGRLPARELTND